MSVTRWLRHRAWSAALLGLILAVWSEAAAQDPDLISIGGNAAERCELGWVVLRRSVEREYFSGDWDEGTGRASSATIGGIARRAGRSAPPQVRAAGLAEIDRKIADARAGRVPANPALCGPAGLYGAEALPPANGTLGTGVSTRELLSFDECRRLIDYRDGLLFSEWRLAEGYGSALADKHELLREARNGLVESSGFAASNWSVAGASFAAALKSTADLALDLSGPVGAAARKVVKPLDLLAKAVREGRTGESGSLEALRSVALSTLLSELTDLRPVAGGLARLARNSQVLVGTLDGWKQLEREYRSQLAILDQAIASAAVALLSYRAEEASLEAVKQRIDQELVNCRIYYQ